MEQNKEQSSALNKKYAAVCGLYCQACSWFISTSEDNERLKKLAAELNISEEEGKCYGCRSDKRLVYCEKCKMYTCAMKKGIDFCSECEEYPCDELKLFQSAMPHRIELWDNLDRIRTIGYKRWLKEIRNNYKCPTCDTINSTYDLKCRKCGTEPSCAYVEKHRAEIEQYIMNK